MNCYFFMCHLHMYYSKKISVGIFPLSLLVLETEGINKNTPILTIFPLKIRKYVIFCEGLYILFWTIKIKKIELESAPE